MLTENGHLKSLFKTLDMPVCRNIAMSLVGYLTREDI